MHGYIDLFSHFSYILWRRGGQVIVDLSRSKYQDKVWTSAISCCWIVMDHCRCHHFGPCKASSPYTGVLLFCTDSGWFVQGPCKLPSFLLPSKEKKGWSNDSKFRAFLPQLDDSKTLIQSRSSLCQGLSCTSDTLMCGFKSDALSLDAHNGRVDGRPARGQRLSGRRGNYWWHRWRTFRLSR